VAVWKKLDDEDDHIWSNSYKSGGAWGVATAIDGDSGDPASSPCVSMNPSGDAAAGWSGLGGSGAGIWFNRRE
jgi:hypothetical protein